MRRSAAAILVWVGLLSVPAQSDDSCKPFDDASDKFMLGRFPLGTDLRFLSGVAEAWRKCLTDRTNECTYSDGEGVVYVTDYNFANPATYILTDVIVQDLRRYSGHLIAGVAANDTIATVERKLESLPEGFPQWKTIKSGDEYVVISNDCLRSSAGWGGWGFELTFDPSGHLISVRTWIDRTMEGNYWRNAENEEYDRD